ncbi:hypothetical protein CPB83DRAFT_850836 [Crepidotus variabilis]|uniref:Uncharacterized protein n=1 Tax=Crepidotus variabilis TaxID=179855 RepID=A0A9P6EJS2_9AGAR|nr:hypothetical protein CPB83DRAFT_850836 [Crepidotus variabilis]
MTSPALPKLSLHHGSSAIAISQSEIVEDLPTTMKFQPVKIRAAPISDLWRKPPNTDVDNAPTVLISVPLNLHKFHSAKVTVSANWNTQYDQGGLVLFIPDEDTTKWVKTGIEFVSGAPKVSTVAASRWADWSIAPLPEAANGKLTIQVERETKGTERVESLWIYIVNEETGEKEGIREVTWWFRHDLEGGQKAHSHKSLLVGVYGARPSVPEGEGREKEELVVNLDGFEVTMFED